MDDKYAEVEKNKILAKLQREVALETKNAAIGEMGHAWRWVMASVLAINSGGLIASLAKIDDFDPWSIVAVACFYFGVMSALVLGWRQISLIQRLLPLHNQAIVFWESASIDGEIGKLEDLEKIRDSMIAAGNSGLTSNTLSRISFVLFSAGLFALGYSAVEEAHRDQPASIEEIQSD